MTTTSTGKINLNALLDLIDYGKQIVAAKRKAAVRKNQRRKRKPPKK